MSTAPQVPQTSALLKAWILDALVARGRNATGLEVARHVWRTHEQHLRGAGDLIYTWQIDLVTAASELIAAGTVHEVEGQWKLAEGVESPPLVVAGAWREAEIEAAVAAYVELLLAQNDGTGRRRSVIIDEVAVRTGRTDAQLDRIFSNISHVIQEHGYSPLADWGPRSNVPSGVHDAVARALARFDEAH